MIDVVPFQPDHLHRFAIANERERAFIAPIMAEEGYAHALAASPNVAFSAIVDDQVIGAAGLIQQWPHRYIAWALLSQATGPKLRAITTAIQRGINLVDYHRIEAHVRADYALSIRWSWKLGFHCESLMKRFLPDGADAFLFVRLR